VINHGPQHGSHIVARGPVKECWDGSEARVFCGSRQGTVPFYDNRLAFSHA